MEIIVVGTGVSAMLLAESLIQRRAFRTLRLVGTGGAPGARRFSYWSEEPTPFDPHADASWSDLRVVGPDSREVFLPLTRHTYRTFPVHPWFAEVRERVLSTPGVEVVDARMERVERVGDGREEAVVHAGRYRFQGDWVFSSAAVPRPVPTCRQRFEGWEVALPSGGLDPDCGTLMDFRTPADGDFRFLYALPLGPGRLFVEHVSYQPADHERHLRSYLTGVLGLGGWELVEREGGSTPVYRDPPPRRNGRVVRIGVAAGLAKTATGYALLRMWRDAEAIAGALARGRMPRFGRRPGPLYRIADLFFLDLLRRDPTQLPHLLEALFSGASGDAALAFLDERASLREQLQVARAVPGWLRWWLGRGRELP